MNLKNVLRTGLTICTLAGASLTAKPAEGLLTGSGDLDDCETMRYAPLVHTVEGNENLWDIARLYFGEFAERNETGKIIRHHPTEIARANHIKTPYYIHPKQRLVIPGRYDISRYHCLTQ